MKNADSKFLVMFWLSVVVLVTSFANCSPPGFALRKPTSFSEDPFLPLSWHLHNLGQSVFALSGGTSGNDLNLMRTWSKGLYGKGIKIMISDSGVEDTHEDLRANFLYSNESKDYTKPAPYLSSTAPPYSAQDNHGTPVAGLVAAVGWNGKGSRGVAPKASLLSANFLSSLGAQTSAQQIDQANGDFDILNMSWGISQNTLTSPDVNYEAQLKHMVSTKRAGRGAIFVKASGNSFYVRCRGSSTEYCIGNSNFDGDDTNPYTLVVSALSAEGISASYSSAGSNIWIASFGGEFGDESPAMMTTDRTGCDLGYSQSGISSNISFQKGSDGNTGCKYSVSFNGTSSAAPVASGAIALLLEANPNLTWRDIKYILAKTASPVDFQTTRNIPHPLGVAVPTGYAWEQPWVVNKAGFNYHNWYGFGRLNVDAAVDMAQNYSTNLGTYTETNFVHDQNGLSLSVPDNTGSGVTATMNVTQNLKIEGVQLQIWATHSDISELAIELTSPQGTKSILVNMRNSLVGLANYEGDIFLSNAFFQESTQGLWTVRVIDGKPGQVGTLTRWRLNFVGGSN